MTKTTHIMLDLETWGKRPGCDIRSIGAVVFDPVAGWVAKSREFPESERQFYIATDNPEKYYLRVAETEEQFEIADDDGRYKQPCGYKYPLHRDPETVEWWSKQSPEAQAAFANPVDLREACFKFAVWLETILPNCTNGISATAIDLRIWANGPQFDVSILEAVYHAVGLPIPWHYRAPRDFRTITDAAGMTRDDFSNYGDAHNALHDAIAQAMTICEAYERLGLNK